MVSVLGARDRAAGHRRRARIAALVWGGFLLALTSWPSPPEVPVLSEIPGVDKIVHGLLYAVEGFLLYFAIAWKGPPASRWLRVLAIAGVLAVWGTLDEIHQAWIPGRMPEAGDALVDAVGGFAGALVASWTARGRSYFSSTFKYRSPGRSSST